MGVIYNESGADFVYWFNESAQTWVSHTGGVGANADTVLFGGSAVWLFKNTNGSWFRDVSIVTNSFLMNISAGGNFLSAQFDYNFTNLSNSFTNRTTSVQSTAYTVGGFFNGSGQGNRTLSISEVEFYSYYNNSDQRYISYFRNDTFNNGTFIKRGDVVFIGTPLNITWDGLDVRGNWSLLGTEIDTEEGI